MARLKDLCQNPELFSSGHRACAGCGEALAVRQILLAAPQPVVGIMPTGCTEIFSSIYPHNAWQIPMIHTAFETAASTASGVIAAYNFRKRMGNYQGRREVHRVRRRRRHLRHRVPGAVRRHGARAQVPLRLHRQ